MITYWVAKIHLKGGIQLHKVWSYLEFFWFLTAFFLNFCQIWYFRQTLLYYFYNLLLFLIILGFWKILSLSKNKKLDIGKIINLKYLHFFNSFIYTFLKLYPLQQKTFKWQKCNFTSPINILTSIYQKKTQKLLFQQNKTLGGTSFGY